MNNLLQFYQNHGIKFLSHEVSSSHLIVEFFVKAKPGSKKISIEILEGELVVKTSGKAVEGEANKNIILLIAELFAVSKSSVVILKGDKSKHKRVQVSINLSPSKDEKHFVEQFTLSLKNLA